MEIKEIIQELENSATAGEEEAKIERLKDYYEKTQEALKTGNHDPSEFAFDVDSLIEEKAFEFKALVSFGEIGQFGETDHLMIKSNIGESPFHDDCSGKSKLAYAQSYTRRIADKISADKNFRVGVYSVNAKINSDRTLIMDSTWAIMEMSATLD